MSDCAPAEGSKVWILEADDGSGWVKVIDAYGDSGLIPASYIEVVKTDASKMSVHLTPMERGKVIVYRKTHFSFFIFFLQRGPYMHIPDKAQMN